VVMQQSKLLLKNFLPNTCPFNDESLAATCATLDGSLFVFSESGNEVVRVSLFPLVTNRSPMPVISFGDYELSASTIEENSVGGFMKNLFGTSKVDLNTIFEVDKPPPQPPTTRSSGGAQERKEETELHHHPSSRTTHASRHHDKDKDQQQKQAKQATTEKKSRLDTTKSEVGEIGQIMNENMQKLQERGEKLSSLENNTEELSNESSNFLAMAKKLRQQQTKAWYEF